MPDSNDDALLSYYTGQAKDIATTVIDNHHDEAADLVHTAERIYELLIDDGFPGLIAAQFVMGVVQSRMLAKIVE